MSLRGVGFDPRVWDFTIIPTFLRKSYMREGKKHGYFFLGVSL